MDKPPGLSGHGIGRIRQFFASLRGRAMLLVLLAILPVLALTLYAYLDQRHQAIHEVQRDELVTARNLAVIQESLFNYTRQLLTTLARLPEVQQRDRQACDRLFARLLEQGPYYSAIVGVDAQGMLFASAPASPLPVSYADRRWFQETVQRRTLFIAEPLLGRISQKYSLNLAYPIMDDKGGLQGVLTVGIDLHWLGGLLAKSDFPPETAVGLIDAAGRIIFRYPDPQKYSSMMAPKALLQALKSHDEGVAEGGGLPGDERLFAFFRLSPPWDNLRVALGLPRQWALEPVNRNLLLKLLWLTAVALIALSTAKIGAKIFIIQPVGKLLEVTRRLTHGDLTARTGVQDRLGELPQLAQAFDQMADSLQERDADLKQTAAELAQRVEELHRQSLELAEANRELENFTYSVAHDLRAPLRAIGGFARVLLDDYPDKLDADGQRYLHIIHSDAGRMGRLIDDLLSLARLGRQEMKFASIDMTAIIQEVFNRLQSSHPGRDLRLEIQTLPEAWGNPVMIRLVLENLLLNAIKFTRDRAPAVIQVSGWHDDEKQEQVYCVKDNGVGFDMRYVDKLFGVFQRLHPEKEFEGTGVGLAIVKRVIDRHCGRVWAEGRLNEGAAFYFTIPCRTGA